MTFLNTLQIISLSNNTIFHCVHISNVLVLHFWHSIGVTSAYSAEPPWLARPSRPQRPLVLGRAWILQNRKRQQRHTADVAATVEAFSAKKLAVAALQWKYSLQCFHCTSIVLWLHIFAGYLGKSSELFHTLQKCKKYNFSVCPNFHCTFGIHCSGCTVYSVLLYFLWTAFICSVLLEKSCSSSERILLP